MLYKAYYKCKEKIMKTLRFSNINDLLIWCTTAELAADVSPDWWCGVDEEGNEFHLDTIEIYVK